MDVEKRQKVQAAMLQKIRDGTATPDDRLELFNAVKSFCWHIINRYKPMLRLKDEQDDLEQEAYIAVQDAAATYNPETDRPFSSWLAQYLHKSFCLYVGRQNGHGPSEVNKSLAVRHFEREYMAETGHGPTDKQICHQTGISPETLKILRSTASGPYSLDKPNEDGGTLMDELDDTPESGSLEDRVTDRMLWNEIRKKLAHYVEQLPGPERQSIVLTFYEDLNDNDAAALMGIEPARFRQIRKSAIHHLQTFRIKTDLRKLTDDLPDWVGSKAYQRGRSTERTAIYMVEQQAKMDREARAIELQEAIMRDDERDEQIKERYNRRGSNNEN